MAPRDWQGLTRLTARAPFSIDGVAPPDQDVAVEGQFDMPPLGRLAADDQIFVAAFVRCHGSIKQMEKFFGVSYPTIKNRLNRIGAQLPFAEIDPPHDDDRPAVGDLLTRLERGEMSVNDVLAHLQKKDKEGER